MDKIYLPTLHWFAMENHFSGSCGEFRYMITPKVIKKTAKEVDFEASTMVAEYWHGLYCKDLSQMEAEMEFPMTDEGRSAMQAWLESNI